MESLGISQNIDYFDFGIYLSQTSVSRKKLTRAEEKEAFIELESHFNNYAHSILRTGQAAQGIKSFIELILDSGLNQRDKNRTFKLSGDNRYYTSKGNEITPILLKKRFKKLDSLLNEFIGSSSEDEAIDRCGLIYNSLYDLNFNSQFMIHSIPRMVNRLNLEESPLCKIIESENVQNASDSYEAYLKKRNEIVQINLRLVINNAKRYGSYKNSLKDLVQEGNRGLIRATEGFDYRVGTRFSTYANWWIRSFINRCLPQNEPIRLPGNVLRILTKISRKEEQLCHEIGRSPTSEELSISLRSQIPNIDLYLRIKPIFSLDYQHNYDGSQKLSLSRTLKAHENHQVNGNNAILKKELERTLCLLDPLDQEIIKLRFGLEGRSRMTLKKIGDEHHLTKERIRQREKRALKILRENLRISEELI
jgi:RNA polymerase primary sigma factor